MMTARIRIGVLAIAAACAAAVPARAGQGGGATADPQAAAQTPVENSEIPSGFVDVGVRGTDFAPGSNQALFERYRDLRNGPTADLFHYAKETDTHSMAVAADHIGYRDQRYSGEYNRFGKLKLAIDWNQIPIFYSQDTATLYASPSPGVLLIDDSIQNGLQNKTITTADAVKQAVPFELRSRRDVFSLGVSYVATPNLEWNVLFRNTHKEGNQQWAGTFGFNDAVELPLQLDTHTTEVGTALEWSNSRGMAHIGYDGSFFRNDVQTLVWDNPLRSSDSPTLGPLQGRMALWPDSNLNAGNASGYLNLPARTQATGYISIGNWSQNGALIPFTINGALPVIPLDRATAEAKAIVTAMNYALTSHPANRIWLTARYRSYDFDNRTPVFAVPNTISYDTTAAPFAEGGTSPYSFNRKTFDADASVTPYSHLAFRAGYTHEQVKQTFRTFDTTNEHIVRLSADATNFGWVTVRAVYEHAKRVGSGLDEQTLDDIGEQVSLRQFDISDRDAHRVSGIVQVMPLSTLSFNGTISSGREERPGAVFGLRSNDNDAYSIGFDFVPRDTISLGASYQHEKYHALQGSRQANPGAQFDDPTRDWTTDGDDRAHTVTASLDLLKLWPKTDIRVAYDLSDAESVYVYGLAPNTTLPPVAQLPPVKNEFQRATIDVRYSLTRHFAVGGYYWYDKYSVNDFAFSPETLSSLAQPSFIIIGNVLRPYRANTVAGRVTYAW